MLKTETCIETRYPDCDRMGIAHHAVFPVWYEVARMEWLTALGLSFSRTQALGLNPTMVDLHIRYLAPASYPQQLYIHTWPTQVLPKKLELCYELRDESGRLLSEAKTFHIWTGPDNRSYDVQQGQPELYKLLLGAIEA